MQLDIIQPDKEKRKKGFKYKVLSYFLTGVALIFTFIFSAIFNDSSLLLISISFLGTVGFIGTALFLLLKATSLLTATEEIGTIEFNDDSILVNGKLIELSEQVHFRFNINGYKGERRVDKEKVKLGDENYLIINNDTRIEFFIENETQVEQLGKKVLLYYMSGVKIKESYNSYKSYLLQTNLPYEEIQMLKKKYDITFW